MHENKPVLLCCMLWANPEQRAELNAYETQVLSFMPDVGAEIIQRVIGDGANGQPDEVQILSFPSNEALDAFVADPRRTAMAEIRDRVVARTELFPVFFATTA